MKIDPVSSPLLSDVRAENELSKVVSQPVQPASSASAASQRRQSGSAPEAP